MLVQPEPPVPRCVPCHIGEGCRAMSDRIRKLCKRHGLRYLTAAELTISRHRARKGFTYRSSKGEAIADRSLRDRIRALVLPPAWEDVRIAVFENAHLQAVGRDAAGRMQYRYHGTWAIARSETKGARLLAFGAALPKIRSAVEEDIKGENGEERKIVAAAVRLIDRALIRAGNCRYARKDGGRGAATLLKQDVRVRGSRVSLDFHGKSGKRVTLTFADPSLAPVVKRLQETKGRRLFSIPTPQGRRRPVTARDVNEYLAEVAGTEVSAKDFRTFGASAKALETLITSGEVIGKTKRTRAVNEAIDAASEVLVNTRAVCRSSYVAPEIVESFTDGKLDPDTLRGGIRRRLDKSETALMRFLEDSAPAGAKRPRRAQRGSAAGS